MQEGVKGQSSLMSAGVVFANKVFSQRGLGLAALFLIL